MEINAELCDEIYEVEKIIARKIYKSKKYYLIKWLYFPINESTWEPKSNLTNINYMMNKFEAEYPSSIDQYMYDIYCEEYKKKIKRTKKSKKSQKVKKLLSESPILEKYWLRQWFMMVSIDYLKMTKNKRKREIMHIIESLCDSYLYVEYQEIKKEVQEYAKENNINETEIEYGEYPDEIEW